MIDSKFNKIAAIIIGMIFFVAGIYMAWRSVDDMNERVAVLFIVMGSLLAIMIMRQIKEPAFVLKGVAAIMILSTISLFVLLFSIGDELEFVGGVTIGAILFYVLSFLGLKKKLE